MVSLRLVLFVLAFACFVASAAGVPSRVNLQSLGLALWVLALFIVG
jgi:hypothetical protein